jgi:hypothetical protein
MAADTEFAAKGRIKPAGAEDREGDHAGRRRSSCRQMTRPPAAQRVGRRLRIVGPARRAPGRSRRDDLLDGLCPRIRGEYRRARASSSQQGIGLVPLEAMAWTPVIAFAVARRHRPGRGEVFFTSDGRGAGRCDRATEAAR